MSQKAIVPTHDIKITLRDGTNVVPPDPWPDLMVGQTVRFYSHEGEVTIGFSGPSPFRTDDALNTTVIGGVIMTLLRDSESNPNKTVHCQCFITLPNGQTVGWGPNSPGAGGDPHIRKPS